MAKPLAPCGTEGAYRRHLRWGQQPCDACSVEHARLQAEYREKTKTSRPAPRELVPCGNESAYRRHLRRREIPCRPCMDAHAEDIRAYMLRRAA